MRIVICDDYAPFAELFAEKLEQVLTIYGKTAELIRVRAGPEALAAIQAASTTALFLDVKMSGINGFQVAQKVISLKNPPLIIFFSNYDHLVFDAFPFRPIWFLRKSHLEELPQVIQTMLSFTAAQHLYYHISVNGANTRFSLTKLLYFECHGHYITLHTATGTLRYKARLSDIEAELKNAFFVRCHIGYLVNCRFIQELHHNRLLLSEGQSIPVSRSRCQPTQNAFMAYMRSVRL